MRFLIKLEELHKLCKDETIVITQHTLNRCRERGIKYEDIKKTIFGSEIIESYPTDYPYPSCLVLGFLGQKQPLHVVVGIGDGKLWIITTYFPTLDKWEDDYKTRKAVNLI